MNSKSTIYAVCLSSYLLLSSITGAATIIGTVKFEGKDWSVDVIKVNSSDKIAVEVWLRKLPNATSLDDKKMATVSANTKLLSEYTNLVCRAKEYTDAGKTIVGCTSIVGASFCAVSTVATDGAMAFVCSATWAYAIETGAADCIEGVAEAMAKFMGKEKEWKALALTVKLAEPKLSDAVLGALELMCKDVKANGLP